MSDNWPLGPYFSPLWYLPKKDDKVQAVDDAMRRVHYAISEAMAREIADYEQSEKRRRRTELIAVNTLLILGITLLIALIIAIGVNA